MRWDVRLDDVHPVLQDLEQQAEGLALADRDAEVAELARAEYAEVDLGSRLHATVGHRVQVVAAGVGALDGLLTRVGDGWLLVASGSREWVVPTPAVTSYRGLSARVLPAEGRPMTARLGLPSALRGVASAREELVLHRCDGTVLRGVVERVGADFAEVRVADAGGLETLPLTALAAVRRA